MIIEKTINQKSLHTCLITFELNNNFIEFLPVLLSASVLLINSNKLIDPFIRDLRLTYA